MKLKELRIGNYVYGIYDDEEGNEQKAVCEIIAIDSVSDNYQLLVESDANLERFDAFIPISIGTYWLKKLGFWWDNITKTWVYEVNHDKHIELLEVKGYYYPSIIQAPEFASQETQIVSLPCISYVHQLQNIIDILKGYE